MTVTNIQDDKKILGEIVNFLRNSDIFSIATRGVTTTTASGTFAVPTSSVAIAVATVKNIRSVVVASVTLAFGTDYTFNLNSSSTCVISFVSAKTGAYTITYDYGSSDKIYDDFPRTDITLSSYPRMSVDITSTTTEFGALDGSQTFNDMLISFNVFCDNKNDVRDYTKVLRTKILEGKRSFYYLRYMVPVAASPIIQQPDRHDKIVLKVLECVAPLNEEITT
jgi:hypothetical protein